MILEGHYKFSFLTGEIPCPPSRDPQEQYWKGEDTLILSCLIKNMEPQIDKPSLYAATVKDIWDTTQKLYSKRQNVFVDTHYKNREIVLNCPNDGIQYSRIEEVCFEVRLEENHTIVTSTLTTPAIDFVAFSAKSLSHDRERHNGEPICISMHCKK
ncbi:UBN2_3 domain-containing protein [Cucumis melo var. makuwa]|uniref:UBN2_3 domain-containing protein n=1 Tax=Cucumis melo var. makuwa TaxID=1194695 RepID=A0A5D3C334_CUCMM|nr:UBN2_3 domain-containing protein [Cucumis melo var. makuwa]